VALEITPPRRSLPRILERRARAIEPYASAINIIQRPDRQTSLQAAIEMRSMALEPVWHLAVRGRSAEMVRADVAQAQTRGIRYVLCILGDGGNVPDVPGQLRVRDAIALVRSAIPDAVIGATLNQHGENPTASLRNLTAKILAGASYIQTQPVFSVPSFESALEPVRSAHPEVRIVPMVMPLLDAGAASRVGSRLGISLGEEFTRHIAAGPAQMWRLFFETVDRLRASANADGLAIMTFEPDPDEATSSNIVEALRRAGIRPRRS
jgi:homocysteine S-methyltransferase